MIIRCLRALDARSFLGLDVWEFSFRSLGTVYGRWFLRSAIVRHPWRALAGLVRYATRVRPARAPGLALVDTPSESEFARRVSGGDWLVAMGFCQKPVDPPCPAGRFNHDCQLLRRNQLETPPPVCQHCAIREMALQALPAGASIYIMTSAIDIAGDMLRHGLRTSPWRGALLALCSFSIPPFSLAMSLCGLQGVLLPYHHGDCRDFPAWLRADEGDKPEQTHLDDPTAARMLRIVKQVAQHRKVQSRPAPQRFRACQSVFVPAYDPEFGV